MVRIDRFVKTFAYMREHLDQWNQSVFINECGTAMCLAGFGVTLFGPEEGFEIIYPEYGIPLVRGENTGTFFYAAKQIFGLTFEEAHTCFIETVNIYDIDELEAFVYGVFAPALDQHEGAALA